MSVRTRFAPSPTGKLHLGNARTAVLNWLVARHSGGEFVLRFEDTDTGRNVKEAEAGILADLDWLGLNRDEGPAAGGPYGPYRQSDRLGLYEAAADKLLAESRAYRCYCTAAELEERRQTARSGGHASGYDGRCRALSSAEENAFRDDGRVPSIRFLVEDEDVAFDDLVKGTVSFRGSDFGDFVISRPDGLPTYNFAVVVDDSHMRISHVIRAVGHLANTPKQVLLYRALGEKAPSFAHIPTVLSPDGGKLSKREGARPVADYRTEGYSADGVLNYLSLLSWSSPSGDEILSRKRLIAEIDLGRTGVADPTLDPEKLRWMSGQHLRALPSQALAEQMAETAVARSLNLSRDDLTRAAEMLADRITTLHEAEAELEDLFGDPGELDEPPSSGVEIDADVCRRTAEAWAEQRDWSPVSLKADILSAGQELSVKGKGLFQPLRLALIGQANGPDVADLAYVLGRERCLERLHSAS